MTEQLDARAGYIAGLRALADALETNPEVPLPGPSGAGATISFQFTHGADPRAAIAAAARAIPCNWDKRVTEGKDQAYFELLGRLHGLPLELWAFRDAVCERVVTGTEDREVEEVVRPAETRTVVKPVEIVEWRCHPLLAPERPEAMVTA
jgi:hypothetical protein